MLFGGKKILLESTGSLEKDKELSGKLEKTLQSLVSAKKQYDSQYFGLIDSVEKFLKSRGTQLISRYLALVLVAKIGYDKSNAVPMSEEIAPIIITAVCLLLDHLSHNMKSIP